MQLKSLLCIADLLSAGAMGLWHGVEYYEKEKVVGEEFYQQWSNVSYFCAPIIIYNFQFQKLF